MDYTRRRFITTTSLLGSSAVISNLEGVAATEDAVRLAPPDKQPAELEVPERPEKTLGWAIVGLGQLALEEVMPAFGEAKLAKPVALVSGHPEKAAKVADAYGIPHDSIYNYENFDSIADNPDIDVVYIILPNSMHAEFTIRALKAGKHVLCEKPMAVSVEEGEKMKAVADETGKKLAIAYRLHYEPLNLQVMAWCNEQKFGKIKSFSASNCQNVKAPNIRLSAKLGGGPLGDVGVYCINAARYVIGEEPVEVGAFSHQPLDDPRFKEVPESFIFHMKYPSGVIASCDCSFGTAESRRFRVHCEKGFIDLDPAFSYAGLKLTKLTQDDDDGTKLRSDVMIEQANHFAREMDGFSEAILSGGEIKTPAEMGIADMKIIEALQEAAKTGKVVRLS